MTGFEILETLPIPGRGPARDKIERLKQSVFDFQRVQTVPDFKLFMSCEIQLFDSAQFFSAF